MFSFSCWIKANNPNSTITPLVGITVCPPKGGWPLNKWTHVNMPLGPARTQNPASWTQLPSGRWVMNFGEDFGDQEKPDTILVQKDGLWHQRAFGTRVSLCGEIVDSDVSPGVAQLVFERLSGIMGARCPKCQNPGQDESVYFDGQIASIKVFDHELTRKEKKRLMTAERSLFGV